MTRDEMRIRRQRLLGSDIAATSAGLEIGPRSNPLVLKSEGKIRYVDFADTAHILTTLPEGIDPSHVAPVDIVWGERPLREAAGGPVDYVVASHVIEHVPDLIGWLVEVHDALRPGGVLGLIVPDRRFTFDLLRQDSVLSEMIEAWLLRSRRPSLRQVFEASFCPVTVDLSVAWRDEVPLDAKRMEARGQLTRALDAARNLRDEPRYIDVHCWVFTPRSFLDVIDSLTRLGLFNYDIDMFLPTGPDSLEFYVRLIAVGPDRTERILGSIARLRAALDIVPEPGANLEEIARAARFATLLDQVDALRHETDALRATIETYRASTSWRVTAPLRAVAGMLSRRRGMP